MNAQLPWLVQAVLMVFLTLAALGLVGLFAAPLMTSDEAGVTLHGLHEPTLPEVAPAPDDAARASGDDPLREALKPLFERYQRLAQDPSVPANPGAAPGTEMEQVAWLCATALEHLYDHPLDKLNRWLGFVQGVLAVNGSIDVTIERDRTRPLFHAAYRAMGWAPPTTLHRDNTPPST